MLKLNRIITILLVSACLILPTAVSAGQKIGKITRLKGRVTIYREGAKLGMTASNGMELQQNDRIKTRRKSYLRFQLNDGSIMTLGQKAEITLSKFNYNPKKKKRVAFFNIAVGKLRVFANKMLKYRDNRFQVKTPTAVAGVRGTVFMVWVESPTVTRIACFDSAVEVSSVMKPDEYVVLTKNILTSIGKGAAPTQPVLMTEENFKEFQRGFDGDIKPVDEETGFKPAEDKDDERSGGTPPGTKPEEGSEKPVDGYVPDKSPFDKPPKFEDEIPVDRNVNNQESPDPDSDPEPEPLPEPLPVPEIDPEPDTEPDTEPNTDDPPVTNPILPAPPANPL